MLVLDSGAVTRLSRRDARNAVLIAGLREAHLWPPIVPSVVLVECLTGRGPRDTNVHRLLSICEVLETVPRSLARRAAELRAGARRGSAVDAIVVAVAEPDGVVLTGDPGDLRALAAGTERVAIERV